MALRYSVSSIQSFLCNYRKYWVGMCGAALLGLSCGSVQAAENDPIIDLRLFGENVIEGHNGCHLAFWQANKAPETDKYAYVFYAPFNDGEELPAWMKVGKTVYEFQRQDSSATNGQALEPLRLYRTSKGTFTTLIEVLDQHTSGSAIVVDKAKLTITRAKHYPFVISVKGGIFCPQQPEQTQAPQEPQPNKAASNSVIQVDPPFGDPVPLGKAVPFDSLDAVPRGIRNAIRRDAPDCAMEQTAGIGAHYAISDAITLWEVPCNLYARTGSSTYVVSMNDNTDYSTVLPFPSLPGIETHDGSNEIRNPQMAPASGTVTSEFYDGDGTCGSFAAYQLRSVEGEALEFFLTEYREKPNCDGVETSARQFPLVYSAR